MKVKKLFLNPITLAGLLLVLVFSTASAATTLCVRPGGGGSCFASIQAAIDIANPGDRINISRGVYVENIEVDVEGLTLRGAGKNSTVIDAEAIPNKEGVRITADNVKVERLAVRNGDNNGIETSSGAANVLIDNVGVYGPGEDCIELQGDDGHVKNSELKGCGADGVHVTSGGHYVRIERNRIMQISSDCVHVDGDYVTIYRNVAELCGTEGLEVDGADPVVNNNTVASSKGSSIQVDCEDGSDECHDGEVRHNKINVTAGKCLEITADVVGGGSFVVERNVCTIAGDDGVQMSGSGITLSRNLVRDGGLNDEWHAGFDIDGTNHHLSHNRVEDWDGQGFNINGSGHELERNESRRSLSDGFRIEGDDVVLYRNVSQSSLGVGFEVTGAAENTELIRNNGFDSRVDFCDDGTGTVEDSNRFETIGDCVIGNN